jgi:predicted nuclease of predicted toxin-antitoxin system
MIKVLVDGMYDGLEIKLGKKGFDAYSIKKLEKEEAKLGHDFNLINFAREHRMVIVTNDREMGNTCKANGFPCVLVNTENILEGIIVPALNNLKERYQGFQIGIESLHTLSSIDYIPPRSPSTALR